MIFPDDFAVFDTVLSAIQGELSDFQSKVSAWQKQLSVKVFDGLEQSSWLVGSGTVANSAGNSATVTALQTQPSVDCASFTTQPKGQFAGAYFYKQLGADPSKMTFRYSISFLFPSDADAQSSQALELDLQQVISGQVFNWGWQFDFAENVVRVWNRAANEAKPNTGWQAINIPCPRWKSGQWMRIAVDAHRTSSSVNYDAITMNGQKLPLTISFPMAKLSLADMTNCAVQLDSNSKGASYRVIVDEVSLMVS